MIYQFKEFVVESHYQDSLESEGTFGRWVEKKVHDNDYLKSIISPFLMKYSPDIRIANAVDMLSEFDKKQIFTMIVDSEKITNESVEEVTQGGKLVFKSFLKSLTSLGINLNKVATTNYIIYYETPFINDDLIVGAFRRFKSLITLFSSVNMQESKCYYAIDKNLNLVYGILNVSGRIQLGSYKLTKSSFEWTKLLNSVSTSGLKRDIMELSWEDMQLLAKITNFMCNYPLGSKDKMEINFDQAILSFNYHGISRWDNGKIDDGEYTNIKTNLKTRLSSEVWSKRILLNVSADNFYVYIKFKLK